MSFQRLRLVAPPAHGSRRFYFLTTLVGIVWLAGDVAVPAEPLIKTIDRHNQTEATAYYLVFVARGGSATGHAFVVWGKDDDKKQLCSAAAFGLYPKDGKDEAKSLTFAEVPGDIADEAIRGKPNGDLVRLIVRLHSP